MRYVIHFNSKTELSKADLIDSSHKVMGWIYQNLAEVDKPLADRTYDFQSNLTGNYSIKHYNFSAIYKTSRGYGLKLSTMDMELVDAFEKFLNDPLPLRLNDKELTVYRYYLRAFRNSRRYFTLSPIFVRNRNHDRRYVYPQDGITYKQFMESVNRNLRLKWEAITGERVDDASVKIRINQLKITKVWFKGYPLHGITGDFFMVGDPRLLMSAYYLGIGSHTACGMGCIEYYNTDD